MDGELRLRSPDGGWRWTHIRAAPVLRGEGNIEKWVGLNIDIEDRNRAEEALRESEERQAFLLKLSDALRAEPDPDAVAYRAGDALRSHAARSLLQY
jgi:PAS domain-containing protein